MPHIYKRNCNQCGKYYETWAQYFCSKKCQYLSLVGKKLTDETKQKIRKAHLGKPSQLLGKHLSKEHKIKIRLSRIGRFGGENHPCWKGGTKRTMGYAYIYMPEHPFANDKYIAEHRYCAEAYLGRFLDPEEIVHHIDGNKTNNLPKNLYLFSSKKEHQTYHRYIKYKKIPPIVISNLF